MADRETRDEALLVLLTPTEKDRLRSLAAKTDRSMGQTVRDALDREYRARMEGHR